MKKKKKPEEEKLNQQFISLGNSYFLFDSLNKTHGIVVKLKSEVLNRKKNGQTSWVYLGQRISLIAPCNIHCDPAGR